MCPFLKILLFTLKSEFSIVRKVSIGVICFKFKFVFKCSRTIFLLYVCKVLAIKYTIMVGFGDRAGLPRHRPRQRNNASMTPKYVQYA